MSVSPEAESTAETHRPHAARGTPAPPGALRVLMRGAVAAETRALAFAFFSFVLGTVVGAVVFSGSPVLLSGGRSVGVTAALVAGTAAGIAFAVNYLRLVRATRMRSAGAGERWRAGLDTVALTVAAIIVVGLLTATVFAVLQLAFRDFTLDPLAAAVVTGGAAAVAAYLLTGAAAQLTTRTIANLLAMLLVSGALASMLSVQNATWWQLNFSALGSGDGFAPYTFNATLVFAGLVIIALTHHLTHDIQQLSGVGTTRRTRVLRVWLATVGVLFAGVGAVSVDELGFVHTVIATSMSLVFAGLIAVSKWLVPWLPRSFTFVSLGILAAFGLVALLMWPVGYFNLTAVELLGAVLLLTWLLLFVRAVAATADDQSGAMRRAGTRT